MSRTYEPIATTTLGSNQSTVSFTSIPGTYTDLILVFVGTGDNGDMYLQFNNDTSTTYSAVNLAGNGSSVFANGGSNLSISYVPGNIRSGTVSNTITHIMNYANNTTYKTFIARAGSADYEVQARVALWLNTSAITSIQVKNTGGNINTGSILTLYGIESA